MILRRSIQTLVFGVHAVLMMSASANAALWIKIDKATQLMTVTVDGMHVYDWRISTGANGYDTPSGTFKPFRMERDHHSDEWDGAPMPFSIFFTMSGNAVHGTYEERNLGRPISHGCVRLSVKNAATLWQLVKQHTMARTTVEVTGPNLGSRPLSLTANGSNVRTAPQTERWSSPYDQQSVNRPVQQSPFFFLFGR